MEKNYSVSNISILAADHREKIRSFDAFTVEQAAGYFDISERRIRQMLATGVLKGTKNGRSWIIDFPFMVRLGTRGPASKVFRRGSCVPKKRWNSSPFQNQKITKGV